MSCISPVVVHGFTSAEYRTNETVLVLVDEFKFFVKGESLGVASTLPGLPGSLASTAITATGECKMLMQRCIQMWEDLEHPLHQKISNENGYKYFTSKKPQNKSIFQAYLGCFSLTPLVELHFFCSVV